MNRWLKTEMVIVTAAMILMAGCTQTPAVAGGEARWKNAVNLLPLIDPIRDAHRKSKVGQWRFKEDGTLVWDGIWSPMITIPYEAPDEYDVRICFTKFKAEGIEKLDTVDVWLPRAGTTVAWCIGGWGNRISGLENVRGLNPSKPGNPTGVKHHALHQIGRKRTIVAKVRKDSITGYLDGKVLTKWKGDWKDLSYGALASRTQLVIRMVSPTIVHSIELLEVTGKGTFTRKAATPIYTKKNAPKTPKLDELPLKKSISQHGITWTFAKPVRAGQFVNGDWYFVGPATVAMIAPKPLLGKEVGQIMNNGGIKESQYPGKQARNGSLLNPPGVKAWRGAAYDSRHDCYAPDLFAHLPIRMKPGDMLISSISRRNDEIKRFDGHRRVLRLAAALTCMGEPQPPDAFRPSYCDTKNSKIYLARNLRRGLLASAARTPGAPSSLGEYAGKFQKPWLDRVWFGRCAPLENNPGYGSAIVLMVGEGSLLLQMDYTPAEKEPLLINMVQVGIDFWGLVRVGRSWPSLGGHHSGRKWPIVFAGVMLGDADMQSPKKRFPDVHFGEDDQTVFCPYTYKGKVYQSGWTGAKVVFTGHSLGGDLNHGPVDLFPPSQWPGKGLTSSEAYRRQSTSPYWVAQALAARMMHAEKAWGHDAFFACVDRWMTEDDTPIIKAVKKARGYDLGTPDNRCQRQGAVRGAPFVRGMWTKYRNNLPPAPDGHKDLPAEKTWK